MQKSDSSTPLPVLDICNSVIVGSNYLSAVESAQLPSVITGDPGNRSLVTGYTAWQINVWQQFAEGLVDSGVVAQSQEMNNLLQQGIVTQDVFQRLVNQSGGPVPAVITMCDDMTNQITAGNVYVEQIITIAEQIKGADAAKLAQLEAIVAQLNSQFKAEEQQLTSEAIDDSKTVVVSVIKIGVAVATEEDPIAPLIEGVAQVGTDIIKELVLSSEIDQTLQQLETAWSALDQVTLQLAQVNLILTRLNAVVTDTSSTIAALNSIVDAWQSVCDVINGPADAWADTGVAQLTEWAARMTRVEFAGTFSQTVA